MYRPGACSGPGIFEGKPPTAPPERSSPHLFGHDGAGRGPIGRRATPTRRSGDEHSAPVRCHRADGHPVAEPSPVHSRKATSASRSGVALASVNVSEDYQREGPPHVFVAVLLVHLMRDGLANLVEGSGHEGDSLGAVGAVIGGLRCNILAYPLESRTLHLAVDRDRADGQGAIWIVRSPGRPVGNVHYRTGEPGF